MTCINVYKHNHGHGQYGGEGVDICQWGGETCSTLKNKEFKLKISK